MKNDPRQSQHKPNAQQGGDVIMVQHHNDADVMSAEQVQDCLLNPNDPNQQIPKLIYSLARQNTDDPNTLEDMVQRGFLFAAQRIHDKWCKPSDSGETIVSLGQMVRAITANKFFLEKQMIIEAQNATSQIEIKDNYGLYEERKEIRNDLLEAGDHENQSYSDTITSDGEESEGMSDEMFQNASGGLTPCGHKLYEQPDYETKMHWSSLSSDYYEQLLPKLSERDQQLYEYKVRLRLRNQEIAGILGAMNANTVANRWKRLSKRLERLAAKHLRKPNKTMRHNKAKTERPYTLIQTELVKAAIKHGIMSQEVEQMLRDKQ